MSKTGFLSPRVFVAALIVLGAGTGGYLLYRASQPPAEPPLSAVTAPAESDSSDTSGAAPLAAEAAAPTKAVPSILPEITLADIDGKPTKLSSFAGRPLMVNFWATWCAPCRREIPLLNRLRAQRKSQNAEIVGIAVDFRDDVLTFLKTTPLEYPLLIGEEDGLAAAEAFGMGMGFPFSVFSDSQNRILAVKIGELHEDEANFAFDRLRDIDNGVLSHEAAKTAVAEAFREMAAARAQAESTTAGT